MDGWTDGVFQATGQKFFNCPYGRGLYYFLRNLKPDQRYATEVATDGNRKNTSLLLRDCNYLLS